MWKKIGVELLNEYKRSKLQNGIKKIVLMVIRGEQMLLEILKSKWF